MRYTTIALLAIVLAARSASAVPLGQGSFILDIQGDNNNNVSCSRATSWLNQTYDVFGVNVNLSTQLGDTICTGSTVNGVAQVGGCASHPDPSILSLSSLVDTLCLNPPSCSNVSFVSHSSFPMSGSLATTIGADVVYTFDGQINALGPQGGTSIPAPCNLSGSVFEFTGTVGINAFQVQTTAVGNDQTVTFPSTTFYDPLTLQEVPVDVGVTFSQVTGSGTTSVTATSNATGTIPSNFAAVVNGYQAAFLDITTTATIVPPIEVCTSYADANDDGFVDGTSPPLPESALSLMHAEGGTFVDRTSSRDPVNNRICAQTESLSPFATLVRTSGVCAAQGNPCDDGNACTLVDTCDASLVCVGSGAPSCDDGNVCTADSCQAPLGCIHPPAVATGCNTSNDKALLMVRNDSNDSKDQVLFKWLKGSSPIGDFGDPTATTDYTLCAFDANKVLASVTAPAAASCNSSPCWRFTGPAATPNGVKYADSSNPAANNGVKLVKGKADTTGKGQLMYKALGINVPALDVANIVYPVTVQVRTSDAACWEQQFTSGDQKKNDGKMFKAVHVGP